MRGRLVAIGALLLGPTSCTDVDCIPTTTVAEDAAIVAAPNVARSGVVAATLTAKGRALPEKMIEFTVEESLVGSNILGSARTAASGRARVDLKDRPLRFVKTIDNDEYTAAFGGDARYCSSSDRAALDIAHVEARVGGSGGGS